MPLNDLLWYAKVQIVYVLIVNFFFKANVMLNVILNVYVSLV